MENRQYLTAREVAERYGISYATVLKMAKADEIPCFRPRGTKKFIFPLKAIEAFEVNLAEKKNELSD